MDAPATPAPAQPAPSTDLGPAPSAPSAPARIDTGDYLQARNKQDVDRKAGAPAPVTPEPKETPAPAPAVSKRQEKINDYERTIASLRSEMDALKAGLNAPRPPAAPAPPAPEKPVTQAEYKRYLAMPEAPKIEDFESIPEFSAAMGVFIADQRWADHSKAASARSEADQMTAAQSARATDYAGRMKEAATADPQFWESIAPEVVNLSPLSALKPGQAAGPLNVVAEELLSSPVAPQLMRELSKPGALARLEAGPEHLKNLPPAQRPHEHARWIVREIGKLEALHGTAPAKAAEPTVKLLTDNPPPAPRLGSKPNVPEDPVEAALKRKNTGDFLEARRQQDLAKMGKR